MSRASLSAARYMVVGASEKRKIRNCYISCSTGRTLITSLIRVTYGSYREDISFGCLCANDQARKHRQLHGWQKRHHYGDENGFVMSTLAYRHAICVRETVSQKSRSSLCAVAVVVLNLPLLAFLFLHFPSRLSDQEPRPFWF